MREFSKRSIISSLSSLLCYVWVCSRLCVRACVRACVCPFFFCCVCLFQSPYFIPIPFLPLAHQSLSDSFPLQTCLSRSPKDRAKRQYRIRNGATALKASVVTITNDIYLRIINTSTVLSLTV